LEHIKIKTKWQTDQQAAKANQKRPDQSAQKPKVEIRADGFWHR
jgi:hypothetical protein